MEQPGAIQMRWIMCPGILQAFKCEYFPHFARDHAMRFAFYAFTDWAYIYMVRFIR